MLLIVAFNIFLLLNFSIANSHIINQTDSINNNPQANKIGKIIGDALDKSLGFLVSFFSIKQIGIVSAASACCEMTINGAWCQNQDSSQCDSGTNPLTGTPYKVSPNECSTTSFCELGWCFEKDQGVCAGGSPRDSCTAQEGLWWKDFNSDKCSKGCCTRAGDKQYVEKDRCEFLSALDGIKAEDIDWNLNTAEVDCKFYSADEGACVYSVGGEKKCDYTTQINCHTYTNVIAFKPSNYCSDPVVDAGCIAHASFSCVEGKEDIYWYDSCGNPEDINTDCGYPENICSTETGVAQCSSLNCIDEHFNNKYGRQPKNGEEWCVYDTYVGEGDTGIGGGGGAGINPALVGGILPPVGIIEGISKFNPSGKASLDVPGSTHWKRYCSDGQVKYEMCGTSGKREEICAEKVVEDTHIAQCRSNFWTMCFGLNKKDECEYNPDCRWNTVDLTGGANDNFKFSLCVPKYPAGFFQGSQEAKDVCGSLGTVTCTSIWKKGYNFAYKCIANCKCTETTEFAKQLNNLCQSLGDCGLSYNLAGDISGDIPLQGSYKRPSENEWKNMYEEYLNPAKNYIGDKLGLNTPNYTPLEDYSGTYSDISIKTSIPEINSKDYFSLAFAGFAAIAIIATGGTALLAIAAAIYLYAYSKFIRWVFGIGSTKEKQTKITCVPWKPQYGGGEDCTKCNNPGIGYEWKQCTKYRCEALGSACVLEENVAVGEDPLCYDGFYNDGQAPIISFDWLQAGLKKTLITNGVEIRKSNGDKMIRYDTLSLRLKTDEHAECRFDLLDHRNFNQFPLGVAPLGFQEGNDWAQNHNIREFPLVGADKMTLYVKCIDKAGNYNPTSYKIEVPISPVPDTNPPEFKREELPSGSYLAMNVTESPYIVYLDGPAECRYSSNPHVRYENMTVNSMICNDPDQEALEWHCGTILTSLTQEVNRVYVRCNDTSGNINPNDHLYILRATVDPLIIEYIKPNNGTFRETPISLENPLILEVKTAGGANSGESNCTWNFLNSIWWDMFNEFNSRMHRYDITGEIEGNFTMEVECIDVAGNEVNGQTIFTIDIDKEAPRIINNRTEEANLVLISDEEAMCTYDVNSCNFAFENGEPISSSLSLEHVIYDLNPRFHYYIRCEDEYANQNCSYVVEPTEIDDGLAPSWIRAYYYQGDLKIITNEEAKCYWHPSSCGFSLEAGTLMTDEYGTGFYTEHTVSWDQTKTYNIKCVDGFGNSNIGCMIVVKSSETN